MEKAIDCNFEEFQKVVNSRRSVRKFSGEKVPEGVIEKCLDLALAAPNSSNLQPWQFYWVRNSEKKSELAKYCFSQPAATTASDLIAIVARPDEWKKGRKLNLDVIQKMESPPKELLTYYNKLIPFTYLSDPFGILKVIKTALAWAIGLFTVSYRGPFGYGGNLLVATKTTALAAENLMLAFRAAGFDSCPMEGFDQTKVKKLLDLPCGAYITMILGIGKRADGGIYGPRLRGDRNQFIFRM